MSDTEICEPIVGLSRTRKSCHLVSCKAWSGQLASSAQTVAGLIAVIVGVVAIAIIAAVAMLKNSSHASTIATGTAGVLGSVVGTYLGVKIGTDVAGAGRREESARADAYRRHIPEDARETAERDAHEAGARARRWA